MQNAVAAEERCNDCACHSLLRRRLLLRRVPIGKGVQSSQLMLLALLLREPASGEQHCAAPSLPRLPPRLPQDLRAATAQVPH